MKIFQLNRVYFATLGIIDRSQSIQNNLNNFRNLFAILLFGSFAIQTVGFLLYKVKSLDEISESVFISCSAITMILNYSFALNKMAYIFRFINELESLINARKKLYILLNFVCSKWQKINKIASKCIPFRLRQPYIS